jgi:MFS family permease
MNTRVLALPRAHVIYTIAVIGFIFTLHAVIPMYSNSSFLSLFMDEKTLGFIYMAGAAVSILGFLLAPPFIRRFGNYKTSILLICIQILIFYGIISTTSTYIITLLFILQLGIVSLIGLTLDIFLEGYSDQNQAGSVHGFYISTLNASWVIAPLIGSMLINGTNNYRATYVAALAMLFPLLYLVYRNFPRFHDPKYVHLSPVQLVKHISKNKNWVKLFVANVILQTFYSWMVVYSPIYLNKTIGLTWENIGLILVVMLIPFPLIQYPLGKLADKKYGEKEIMSLGFAIMGVATILLSYMNIKSVLVWAMMLMVTRIGAAAAEIMLETYFFKTVPPQDSETLGMFRITRPLSYFLAPLIMIVSLTFMTEQYVFTVIGVMCLLALHPALTIRDTK